MQEIPLNGRHFVDLGPLMPGGVTPPQNAGLSAPLRGQGSFSFFSAGNRETSVNFMLNGINLNDLSNSQVDVPAVDQHRLGVQGRQLDLQRGVRPQLRRDRQRRDAVGRQRLHGEAFDFYRDDTFDSRNYFNPPSDPRRPDPKSPFNRKQFGVNLGGPIVKNKTFYFFSYEGLRHTQGVDLNSGVLTEAQRAGGHRSGLEEPAAVHPAGRIRPTPTAQARLLASGTRAGQHRPVHDRRAPQPRQERRPARLLRLSRKTSGRSRTRRATPCRASATRAAASARS